MATPLRIGIIGCGRILPAHLHGFRILREHGYDDFRITALCARKRDDALMFRKRGEGPPPRAPVIPPPDPLGAPHIYVSDFQDDVLPEIYSDWREVIARDDVDAVEIYTSLFNHHEIAVAALNAGKHVFVQKPMAVSVRAAQAMIAAAKKNDRVLGVAECARYRDGVRALRWAIEEGLLGDIQMAFYFIMGGFWSPDQIVAETPWRHSKLLGGGGGSVDLGVHFFDVLRYCLGEIDELSAMTATLEKTRFSRDEAGRVLQECACEVDDTFFANFSFANGALGHMAWSWAGHGPATALPGLTIYGSRGCYRENELHLDGGRVIPLVPHFKANASAELQSKLFPRGIDDVFALEEVDFQLAIAERRAHEVSGEEGLRDLAASFAILESALLKRTVRVREVASGAINEYQREIDAHYGL